MSISAVVNTLNEERHIEACLESLSWVDEIVVVDMHSVDRTVELARRFTDRIYFHEQVGYVEPARNFAIGQATGSWVLVLDADERVPALLAKRLRDLAEQDAPYAAVLIPRKNHFCGLWLTDPNSYPDHQTRFFRKNDVTWSDVIHSQPEVRGEVMVMEPDPAIALEHLANETISAALQRLDRYSSVEAERLHREGAHFDWWKMIAEPVRQALKGYFEWGLHRQGVYGVVEALLAMFHEAMVQAKLWELSGCGGEDDPEIRQLRGRRNGVLFLLNRLLRRPRSRAGGKS